MEQQGTDRLIILGVFALVAVVVVAAILISRSGGGDDETTATAASSGGCEEVKPPQPKQVSFKAPKQTVEKGEELNAVVETSCGTFDIALDTARAPKIVNSFAFLADEGFYDG